MYWIQESDNSIVMFTHAPINNSISIFPIHFFISKQNALTAITQVHEFSYTA